MTTTIRLRDIDDRGCAINFTVMIESEGARTYETDVKLYNQAEKGFKPEWVAEMTFSDMPGQESPEDAIDRMGLYLRCMAKAMKGKHIKPLHVDTIFKPIYK